ncbi:MULTISPECIES: transglycosylase domain-containing protein [unclassified Streptomyces]|uniref:transglycosylase domain-containing protein n=1 Tax=unclassified Streptomyces TaxID=2593676 RepID=UPI002ED10B05|nr:penicillin-binding protein [Streptomyces sp. NBC_00891]WSY06546.1 penicillin-binding protein [Streptomyces sp. NBC_00890]WSZ08170.1 penicillin-binding protein [Streptomyces sp. NBC_00869]WSZ24330.1 penicillin-binding protein [Streptomyces sp. NBC_00870]
MSEHRRKTSQPQGGGRAAARRAAQQSSGRRTAPSRGVTSASPSESHSEEAPYEGRAAARRAAQRGGGGRGGSGSGGGRRRGGGDGGPEGRGGRRPVKKRFIDYPRAGRQGLRRWIPSWKLVSSLCIGFLGLLMGLAGLAYAMVAKPDIKDAAKAENNVYFWKDGTQMVATGGEVNRQVIDYAQIPEAMRNAVISAENKSFDSDHGIDPMGIARAVFNMAKGGETQGGSTITQQYVKNSRLSQEQTLSRKFEELFITLKVGSEMKKSEVMEGYLNVSYYGRGASGLQAAARTYYGKDAKDLDPSQCAFMASLLKGASYYDPAGAPEIDSVQATPEKNLERATKRWKWILDEEVKDGRMTQSERNKYTKFPTPDKPQKNAQLGGQIGYLVNTAKAEFLNNTDVTSEQLAQGGYEIHTTFDKKKVDQLSKAVKRVYDENIDPKKRPTKDTHVQFGGSSVDPKTGAIQAIYGGVDATKHYTSNAGPTGAAVGSTFKPFVLAAAMEYGKRDPSGGEQQGESERTKVSPLSIYNGDNKLKIKKYNGDIWTDENGKEWQQTNDDHTSYGPITLREAMQWSANSPYVQLGMDVGPDKVKEAAIAAGLKDDQYMADAKVPSFSIGTSSPSATRMAGAYATFAARGQQREPYSVTEVKKGGEPVYRHKVVTKSAFDNVIADNITDVLTNVVEKGTGTSAKLPGRQVAGKTGTTDDNLSAWFVGYTPQLSTAISMYRLDDDEKHKNRTFEPMYGTGGKDKIHGASFPAQVWHEYMAEAMKGVKAVDFPKAEPIGEKVYGGGASKKPTPTPTPSPTESETTSPTPTPTPTPTPEIPTPDPSDTCGTWGWNCQDNGGTTTGTIQGNDGGANSGTSQGNDGGTDTGTSTGTTEGDDGGTDTATGGNSNGNTNGTGNNTTGSWFGGTGG